MISNESPVSSPASKLKLSHDLSLGVNTCSELENKFVNQVLRLDNLDQWDQWIQVWHACDPIPLRQQIDQLAANVIQLQREAIDRQLNLNKWACGKSYLLFF
jgi:HPt (histidine-containing phosphotransfer) domain-containing protein